MKCRFWHHLDEVEAYLNSKKCHRRTPPCEKKDAHCSFSWRFNAWCRDIGGSLWGRGGK